MKGCWMAGGNRAVVLLAVVNGLTMFVSGLTYPLLPLYLVGHRGCSVFVSGVVASLSSLTSFVFGVLWGMFWVGLGVGRRFSLVLEGW